MYKYRQSCARATQAVSMAPDSAQIATLEVRQTE